jgi:maleylpyruvate isomerase
MTDSTAIQDDLALVEEGTELFLVQVKKLDGTSVHEASALPRWTRGHVITHVARNADGMARLAGWAKTGVEDPMYGDRHPRNRDIEEGAARALAEQERDVRESARRLAEAFGRLSGEAWSIRVRTTTREVEASHLPWMRAREVWLHALDLGAGATYQDLTPGFATRLLDDLVRDLSDRPGMPALALETGDRLVEVEGAGAPIRVAGTPAAVACWMSGRAGPVTRPDGGPVPPLPAWL